MAKTLSTNGDGYEELRDGDERVSVHRLTAVAEFGIDAVKDMDVHHMEIFDGRSCPFLNARKWLEPRDPYSHRVEHLLG